jgi:hypothetical protein
MQIEAANAENSVTNYIMAAFMMLFAALVAWHYKIPLDPASEGALPLAFIPLAFAFIGLWYFAKALLDSIALRLNQRPRKSLGFETPADRLREVLH